MITVRGKSEHGTLEQEKLEHGNSDPRHDSNRPGRSPSRSVKVWQNLMLACILPTLLMLAPVNTASAASAKSTIGITKLPVLGVNTLQKSNMLFESGLNKQQSTVQFRETGQSVPFRLKAAIQENTASVDPRSVGYSVYWEDAIAQSPIHINQQTSSVVLQTEHLSATDEGVISLIKNDRRQGKQPSDRTVDVLVLTFIIE